MTLLGRVAREIWGLFVDDGSLAVAILVLVAALAILRRAGVLGGWACGWLLFLGLLAILLENVRRAARR